MYIYPKQEKGSIHDVLSPIEEVKNGFVYSNSTMYERDKSIITDPPFIIVFSNYHQLSSNVLSNDKWEVYAWNTNKELEQGKGRGDTDDFYQFPTHFPLLQNKKWILEKYLLKRKERTIEKTVRVDFGCFYLH